MRDLPQSRSGQSAVCIGVDLAWSSRNQTGLAAARVSDQGVQVVSTTLASGLDDIVQFVRQYDGGVGITVAIDAPTVVPFESEMRECERILHRDESIRRAHAAPYPGTRRLLGQCNGGMPRGEELVKKLKSDLGFTEASCVPPLHTDRYAIEVFPAAALVRMFGLEAPLVYKKKRGRSWAQCQAGLAGYMRRLGGLSAPPLQALPKFLVDGVIGVKLKATEDQVDAVTCAYIAALAWLGRTETIGTLEGGYIVMPRRRSLPPSGDGLPV